MRHIRLLIIFLAASAHAQVRPISEPIKLQITGASAGISKVASAGFSALPDTGQLLPLSAPGLLDDPAPLPQTAVQAAALAVASIHTSVDTKASFALAASASEFSAASTGDDPIEEHPTASRPRSSAGPDAGKDDDGRVRFDGAAQHPNATATIAGAPEPSRGRRLLKHFGFAGVMLIANTAAYAAVPHGHNTTGTLSRLSFNAYAFLAAFHRGSVYGLLQSSGRAFTSLFMHQNMAHIAGNMAFLLFIAPYVQSSLGARRTSVVYLAGGLIAAASAIFLTPYDSLLGASACISALMGAVLTIRADTQPSILVSIYRTWVQFLSAFFIFEEVQRLILQGPISLEGTATMAHVVGAGVGLMIGGMYALARARARRAAKATS